MNWKTTNSGLTLNLFNSSQSPGMRPNQEEQDEEHQITSASARNNKRRRGNRTVTNNLDASSSSLTNPSSSDKPEFSLLNPFSTSLNNTFFEEEFMRRRMATSPSPGVHNTAVAGGQPGSGRTRRGSSHHPYLKEEIEEEMEPRMKERDVTAASLLSKKAKAITVEAEIKQEGQDDDHRGIVTDGASSPSAATRSRARRSVAAASSPTAKKNAVKATKREEETATMMMLLARALLRSVSCQAVKSKRVRKARLEMQMVKLGMMVRYKSMKRRIQKKMKNKKARTTMMKWKRRTA